MNSDEGTPMSKIKELVLSHPRGGEIPPNLQGVVLELMEAAQQDVYAERNALAVAFTRAAVVAGWRAGKCVSSDEKYWPVVYVDLPDGHQVSWHVPPETSGLEGTPAYLGDWDGQFLGRDPSWPELVGGAKLPPHTCLSCGAPSYLDRSVQTAPADYCRPEDHGGRPDVAMVPDEVREAIEAAFEDRPGWRLQIARAVRVIGDPASPEQDDPLLPISALDVHGDARSLLLLTNVLPERPDVAMVPDELRERCREILEWRKNGVLSGNVLREYASAQWYANDESSLQLAENDTAEQAFAVLAAAPEHVEQPDVVMVPPPPRCAADRDGDCTHAGCPQLRDGEPHATGRHCPLDTAAPEQDDPLAPISVLDVHGNAHSLFLLNDALPTPPEQSQADGRREGIEAVAKMIETQAADYATAYGYDDLGALSFGPGECSEMIYAADHDRIVSALTEAGVKMQAERDQFQRLYNAASAELCLIGEALGVPEDDQCTPEILERIAVLRAERDTIAQRCRNLEAVQQAALGVSGTIKAAAGRLGWTAEREDSALDFLIAQAGRCRELEADYKLLLQYEDAAIRDEAKYLTDIDTLRAEVERLRKDAELFRRLRDLPDEMLGAPGVPCVAVPEGPRAGRYVSGTDLDAAIEASR